MWPVPIWGLHMGWHTSAYHSRGFWGFLREIPPMSPNPRRTPVGIVGQVWMLFQASPEGFVPAASKVGQDLLARPFLTQNEQLLQPAAPREWLFKRTSLFTRLCSGGQTHLPTYLWPSWDCAWLPVTSRRAVGRRFLDKELLTSFSFTFLQGAVGVLSLLEHTDCWARMKAGFKFSLHIWCSSIQMSWWELIPALEEILGVSKMLLIPAVDPNHPLPRDQLVGEC